MPQYRYFTGDLLTGNVLGELPLYGTYFTRVLNNAGTGTGTFKLGTSLHDDAVLMLGSRSGRTALYVERDGELIWGGIIWTRTYSAQSNTVQLSARTFESYFDHVVFDQHFIQQKINQELIFRNMVNMLQGQPGNNIGLTMGALPTTNTPRTILVPGYEYHYAQTVVDDLVATDNGLDYTIDVTPGELIDRPNKIVRLGYPELGSGLVMGTYDYPGNITNYWMPESAANGGVKFAGLGFGSGNKVARAVVTDQDAINDGYPAWWKVTQHRTIADTKLLADKVKQIAVDFRLPYMRPTFELKSDEGVSFDGWDKLGELFKVRIEDHRFPNGHEITSRMLGWEFSPANGDSPEILKFTIEGQET